MNIKPGQIRSALRSDRLVAVQSHLDHRSSENEASLVSGFSVGGPSRDKNKPVRSKNEQKSPWNFGIQCKNSSNIGY